MRTVRLRPGDRLQERRIGWTVPDTVACRRRTSPTSRRRISGAGQGVLGGACRRPAPRGSCSGRRAVPSGMRRRPRERRRCGGRCYDSRALHVKHRPGIPTRSSRAASPAFDLAPGAGRKEAAALLRRWSDTARRLTAGEFDAQGDSDAARDAGPSSLTLTFGFGHSFFGAHRAGEAAPGLLDPLPAFSSDRLDRPAAREICCRSAPTTPSGVPCRTRGAEGRGRGGTGALADERLHLARRAAACAAMSTRNLMGQVDGTPRSDSRASSPSTSGSSCRRRASPPGWRTGSYVVGRRTACRWTTGRSGRHTEQEGVVRAVS
ncbi:hypothetical protein SALBM217S_00755 [Streptomyces griseoloalbus]